MRKGTNEKKSVKVGTFFSGKETESGYTKKYVTQSFMPHSL